MKRHSIFLLSICFAITIAAATYYFYSESTPETTGGAMYIRANANAARELASNDREEQLKKSRGIGGENHPSQTEHVNPEEYRSAGAQQPWEKEIFDLTERLDLADTAKAEQLLSRINGLPAEGKVLAMEYATQLIPDKDYLRLRPWILSLVNSDELRETVMIDALTRAEALRMPTLVEMLRQPPNAAQEEVREILLAYLDVDYGSDVRKWDAAVQRFLAENPDL